MVKPLYEGTYSVGWDKVFHPIGRDGQAAKGALKISLNPFLFRVDGRVVLIDTGLGDGGIESHIPILEANLTAEGVGFDDVTDVLCSHLHGDHIGGLAHREHGFWKPTFPNARVWLSGQEWDKVRKVTDGEDAKAEFLHVMEAQLDLHLLKADDSPFAGVVNETIGGHTEFSLAYWIEAPGLKFVMAGDVIGTKGSINRTYAAKYDFDPETSKRQRERIVERCWNEGYGLLCYHDNDLPVLRLTDRKPTTGYIFGPA